MNSWKVSSPVALIIFNRPHVTERVFAEIARARPSQLLVVADGPRPDKRGEDRKCAATREIIERVDWDCIVLKNYSEINLGCKMRVSSGIDWVFEQVPEAIILEDDCVPHPTFFRFCDTLLDYYRESDRVGMISGNNFLAPQSGCQDSYYFSRYNHIWGWASWRRAWQLYDRNMADWPDYKHSGQIRKIFPSLHERLFWTGKFDKTWRGQIDTWDYQWSFALWKAGLLTALPCFNLVSNIGFGEDATHTIRRSTLENLKTHAMEFPLVHPEKIMTDDGADRITYRRALNQPFYRKLATRLFKMLAP